MPERIGESLRAELDRLDADDGTLAVTRTWEAAVGPQVARNAWPARMRRDGTLVVHARTSVWAFELNQLAEEIRPRLTPTPEGLRFVVGTVPEPSGKTPAASAPQPCPRAGFSVHSGRRVARSGGVLARRTRSVAKSCEFGPFSSSRRPAVVIAFRQP